MLSSVLSTYAFRVTILNTSIPFASFLSFSYLFFTTLSDLSVKKITATLGCECSLFFDLSNPNLLTSSFELKRSNFLANKFFDFWICGRSLRVKILGCIYGLRSEEHTSELQSRENLVCRLLLEK